MNIILSKYTYEFPTSTIYMNKATPLISYARQLFPNAKIAAVSQGNKCTFKI